MSFPNKYRYSNLYYFISPSSFVILLLFNSKCFNLILSSPSILDILLSFKYSSFKFSRVSSPSILDIRLLSNTSISSSYRLSSPFIS